MKKVILSSLLILISCAVFAQHKPIKEPISVEEFDRLFEDDSESNKHNTNEPKYNNKNNIEEKTEEPKKNKEDSEYTTSSKTKQKKSSEAKTNIQVNDVSNLDVYGKNGISFNYSLTTTNLYTYEPALFFSMDYINPYFDKFGLKYTSAFNKHLYWGAGFNFDFLDIYDVEPYFCMDCSLLTGINFNIGNTVRLFIEDSVNYGFLINTFGVGLGTGFDLIIHDDWFVTFGYEYNWQYCIPVSSAKPDFNQTSVYLGFGFTW